MTLRCEILVEGRVGSRLDTMLLGFDVNGVDEGRTRLVGDVPDRAALSGVLARLEDFGFALVALETRPVSDPAS